IGRLPLRVGEDVRLNDPDIDPTQEEDVGDVLKRPLPDDREDAKPIAVIQYRREIGGDPNVRSVDPARDDADRASIGLRPEGVDALPDLILLRERGRGRE